VRIFEGRPPPSIELQLTGVNNRTGIKAKVENKQQYQQYLDELKDLREELGVALVEEMYSENE